MNLLQRSEVEAEGSGFFLQRVEESLLISLFVVVGAGVAIGSAGFEHRVEDDSEFVSGGFDGGRAPVPGLDSAEEGTEGAAGSLQSLSGKPEGLCGTVGVNDGRLFGQRSASGDPFVRREGKPRGEVSLARPRTHIRTGFRKDGEHRRCFQSIDCRQIDTGHLEDESACIEPRLIFATSGPLLVCQTGTITLFVKSGKGSGDLLVTRVEFPAILLEQLDSLTKREQMFVTIVAPQSLGDGLLRT